MCGILVLHDIIICYYGISCTLRALGWTATSRRHARSDADVSIYDKSTVCRDESP
jgi:hypothetical protein